MCICVWVYSEVAYRGQKRVLELQAAVSSLMRALGTELGSFKGTTEPPPQAKKVNFFFKKKKLYNYKVWLFMKLKIIIQGKLMIFVFRSAYERLFTIPIEKRTKPLLRKSGHPCPF